MTEKLALKKQRGWINIPAGVFETLFTLAAIGLIALVATFVYVMAWIVSHVRFI